MKVLTFIFKTSYPFKHILLLMLFGILVMALDANIRPYIIKLLIDKASDFRVENFIFLAGIYVASQFLRSIFHSTVDWCATLFSAKYREHVSHLFLKRITKYSYNFFQDNMSGNITARVSDAFNFIPQIVVVVLFDFIQFIILTVISLTILAQIDWLFSLIALIWIVIFVSSISFFFILADQYNKNYASTRPKIFGFFSDYFSNIISVWCFSTEKSEYERFKSITADFVKKALLFGKFLRKFHFIQGFITTLYMMLILVLLGTLSIKNKVTPGDFALIFLMNYKISDMLSSISQQINAFFVNWGVVGQAIKILDYEIELVDKVSARDLVITKGEICFEKVIFNYKGAESLFQDNSIIIHSGQKVGLVGYSGAGKSTFANLILRLYDVTGGNILIDNQNIQDVSLQSLRRAISIIPQDPSLFHRTIGENIKYGNDKATNEQIIKAAKEANAHDFITKLKDKYNSIVGEKGLKLSGGQRQRIAIARAILKNAPILILDEATSQLDSMTEKEIQLSLWKLMQGKTTIVIAHRLSTLLKMDRILVFDKGKIVEDGTHSELLKNNGLYRKLWDAQVGEFLPENNNSNQE